MKHVWAITTDSALTQTIRSVLIPDQAQLTHCDYLPPADQRFCGALVDVCLLDMREAGRDAIPVLNRIHSSAPRLPILVFAEPALVGEAHESGALKVFTSPVRPQELKKTLDRWLATELDPLNRSQQICQRFLAEIGNQHVPLTTLAEITLSQSDPDSPARNLATATQFMTRQLKRRLRHLHYFSSEPCIVIDPTPLDFLLQQASTIATSYLGDQAAVNVDPICPELLISGGASELSFALAEIIINGLHANSRSPQVAVKLENQSQDSVMLVVTDHGPGFTEEAVRWAGEPFFSQHLHSLGLGLYVARRIIEACGGKLLLPETTASPGVVRIQLRVT